MINGEFSDEADGDTEFSVWEFFPDGTYQARARYVDARLAVMKAHSVTQSVGARMGTTVRVIITDGGDFTVFEWKFGEGVTYPPREDAR